MARRLQPFDPRQNMNNPTFEVFHNYDAGVRNVDPHHHDFYEIYFFLGGDVEYQVEGRTYALQPGELMLITPWKFHQPVVRPGAAYERMVLWIDRNFLLRHEGGGMTLADCFGGEPASHLRPSEVQSAVIRSLMEQMIREGRRKRPGSELYLQGLFLQLMVEINRVALQADPRRETPEEPDLVNQVLAYIAGHYDEKLSLQELADRFYVSKYYLSHAFSAKVGTGIHRYIVLKRLLAAREQIAAGTSPGEACSNCGFQDYANFYRAFKTEYGVSPKAFAAQTRSAQM